MYYYRGGRPPAKNTAPTAVSSHRSCLRSRSVCSLLTKLDFVIRFAPVSASVPVPLRQRSSINKKSIRTAIMNYGNFHIAGVWLFFFFFFFYSQRERVFRQPLDQGTPVLRSISGLQVKLLHVRENINFCSSVSEKTLSCLHDTLQPNLPVSHPN